MNGASAAHNSIVSNLIAGLHSTLRKRPCRVYPSDMRVQVDDGYVYPDVSVVCGKPEFYDKDNLTNPLVIIEVLSPSTADYDGGGKFARYRQLSSLQEYILVTQERAQIMHYVKQSEHQWTLYEYFDDGAFDLPSLECRLSLLEIDEKVFDVASG